MCDTDGCKGSHQLEAQLYRNQLFCYATLLPSWLIFSAEVSAILLALQYLVQLLASEAVVCTDFLSVIQVLSIIFPSMKYAQVKEVLNFEYQQEVSVHLFLMLQDKRESLAINMQISLRQW